MHGRPSLTFAWPRMCGKVATIPKHPKSTAEPELTGAVFYYLVGILCTFELCYSWFKCPLFREADLA